MDKPLYVEIQFDPDAKDMRSEVRTAILQNEAQFQPLFGRLIDHEDARTTLLDDSMTITDLSLSAGGGHASVEFSSAFYAGCRDVNGVNEHEAELPFEIVGDKLVFTITLPPRWVPDPDEE